MVSIQKGEGMKNKIIVVSNIKGGAGKSSLSSLIAMELLRRGHKVTGIDTDPVQVFDLYLSWHKKIPCHSPANLDDLEKLLTKTPGIIVVDTAGFKEELSTMAALYSDLIVCPVASTRDNTDTKALNDFVDHIEHLRLKSGQPMEAVIIPNKMRKTRPIRAMKADLVTYIESGYEVPVRVIASMAIPKAVNEGIGVMDLTGANIEGAQKCILDLVNYIEKRVGLNGK
jgi:cellulose biosynthesis protein BcsQ